jgi:arylsulfatase A-like enzyme
MRRPSVSEARILLLAALLLAFGCGAVREPALESSASPPPVILLVTTTGLRADSVGPLTPHLQHFQEEATWAGTGIAATSQTAPAIASLLTGLRPWQHQVVDREHPALHDSRVTLAEAFKGLGYRTAAFLPNYRLRFGHGYGQGFDDYLSVGGDGPARYLAEMDTPTFIWVHWPEPQPPYRIHPQYRSRLEAQAALPQRLPRTMGWDDLVSPRGEPLRPFRRNRAATLYSYEVAAVDTALGRLVEALKAEGRWGEALVVFTSLHGTELGEHGQLGSGEHLHREVLEVPLIIKLPEGVPAPVLPEDHRPAVTGLWATLVGAAGGKAPPALEPDVLSPAAGRAVLSELYFSNGYHQFSLVEGAAQWLRTVPFAAPEAAYASARLARRGVPARRLPPPVADPPTLPLERLRAAFETTLPFSGTGTGVREERLLWGSQTATPGAPRLREKLRHRWFAFQDRERTPAEERERLWGPSSDEGSKRPGR